MFILSIIDSFSAAHRLVGYPGECANLHGHNWKVKLDVECNQLQPIGLAIDFKELKQKFRQVLTEFDHKYLNELETFEGENPTSELVAKVIFEKMSALLETPNCRVKAVEVWESEKYSVKYMPDESD
jgi:6-pyruvoyltetrahydropterin/6-carboxytetrahydropterin synthase